MSAEEIQFEKNRNRKLLEELILTLLWENPERVFAIGGDMVVRDDPGVKVYFDSGDCGAIKISLSAKEDDR